MDLSLPGPADVPAAVADGVTAAIRWHRHLRPADRPRLRAAWRGRGPVVLVGGFCTVEAALGPLQVLLEQLGYDVLVHTADAGMGCAARSVTALRERLDEATALDRCGDGVRVVGYSRGGQFARVAAADRPVRALVTIGTPFRLYGLGPLALLPASAVAVAGTLGVGNVASLGCLVGSCCADFRRSLRAGVRGAFTSIYSRDDRIVPWRSSTDPQAVNVEVRGSHLHLLRSATVGEAVAAVLAAPAA